MSQRRSFGLALAAFAAMACLLLSAGAASAQEIGGTVSDTTGGVLPGVTVEARSPSIIEGVRTAITDGNGQYLIVALEPGTYSVTYSLPGFSTVVREGIELSIGFTAAVDIELTVGDIEETVTVSGASPVVDIQNIEQRAVMDREIIDSIPSGKSITGYGLLVPGMSGAQAFGSSLMQDAGGLTTQTMQRMSIHGGSYDDQVVNINGMDVASPATQGGDMGFFPDRNFDEMAFNYAANSAEFESGGVNIDMVPKEGANTFSGSFFTTFSFAELMANNLDQDLMDRGLDSASALEKNWTVNPSFGGPIVEDRVWFFVTHTSRVANLAASGVFHSVDPTALTYEPDLSRPAVDETTAREQSMNLTFQVTAKDKLKAYWTNSSTDRPHYIQGRALGALFLAPEAAVNSVIRTNAYQLNWVRPHTNRLLFEAGVSHMPTRSVYYSAPDAALGIPGVLELFPLRGQRNSSAWLRGANEFFSPTNVNFYRASVSYVTGSHNLKLGVAFNQQRDGWLGMSEGWHNLMTAFGTPFGVQYWSGMARQNNAGSLGVYAQEQWTLDRLTVNAGVRWDRIRSGYPDQARPGNVWFPEPFAFEGQTVSLWNDIQPRLGLAYDLRGDGKTALKFSASRYGRRDSTDWAISVNPADQNRSSTRLWADGAPGHPALPGLPLPPCIGPVECIAGDGIPQGDPTNFAPNGELFFPNFDVAWGLPQITTFHDPNWARGWGKRESDWEFSGSVQQELIPGVSLDIGYFRRQTFNLPAVDDRAVGPDDFDVATFTVPTDPRLTGGGGGTLSFYDINPASVRIPDDLTVLADNFGTDTRTWQGFDVTVDARLADVLLQGGVSTGRTSFDYCGVQSALPEGQDARVITAADVPAAVDTQPLEHCDRTENWLTQVKLLGSYTLPYDIQLAATLQNQPGPERKAVVLVTGTETSLGRPLVVHDGGARIDLLAPGSAYGERFNQLDLRFTKILNLGGATRLRAMFDLFNVFNANAVVAEDPTFGANWPIPVGIMPGRLAKFAFQLDF